MGFWEGEGGGRAGDEVEVVTIVRIGILLCLSFHNLSQRVVCG